MKRITIGRLEFERLYIGDRPLNKYAVHNKKREFLGNITWNSKWDCWVWQQDTYAIMDLNKGGCMDDLMLFAQKHTKKI